MIEKLRNGDPPVKVFAESGLTDEFIAATLEIGEKTENYKWHIRHHTDIWKKKAGQEIILEN